MHIILLGPPGSGKGTQGDIISKSTGKPRISTGDLLRDAVKNSTPLGLEARSFMDAGALVPDEVIVGLIEKVLTSDEAATGVLMDGFPRTVGQAQAVDRVLENRSGEIQAALCFDVPIDELTKRLLERAVEQRRSDDNEESIRRRLAVYIEQTEPLISYYQKRDVLRRIDGVGSVGTIAQRVRRALGL